MVIIIHHNHYSNSHDNHCHWHHHLQPQSPTTIIPTNCNPPHPKQNNHPQNLLHHHTLRLQPAKAPASTENPFNQKFTFSRKPLPPKTHLQLPHFNRKPTKKNPPSMENPSTENPPSTKNLLKKNPPSTENFSSPTPSYSSTETHLRTPTPAV